MVPRPQDEALVVKAPKLSKEDGAVSWKRSALQIERLIRAFTPWPGAFTFFRGAGKTVRLIISESRVAEGAPRSSGNLPGQIVDCQGRIVVACSEGFLEILRLKRAGKKEMSAEEFLRGMGLEEGACLE